MVCVFKVQSALCLKFYFTSDQFRVFKIEYGAWPIRSSLGVRRSGQQCTCQRHVEHLQSSDPDQRWTRCVYLPKWITCQLDTDASLPTLLLFSKVKWPLISTWKSAMDSFRSVRPSWEPEVASLPPCSSTTCRRSRGTKFRFRMWHLSCSTNCSSSFTQIAVKLGNMPRNFSSLQTFLCQRFEEHSCRRTAS